MSNKTETEIKEKQFTDTVNSGLQVTLLAKLNKRYNDYLKGTQEKNIMVQNHSLHALIDECRGKAQFPEISRKFVEEKLKITYQDLLLMKRNRKI